MEQFWRVGTPVDRHDVDAQTGWCRAEVRCQGQQCAAEPRESGGVDEALGCRVV